MPRAPLVAHRGSPDSAAGGQPDGLHPPRGPGASRLVPTWSSCHWSTTLMAAALHLERRPPGSGLAEVRPPGRIEHPQPAGVVHPGCLEPQCGRRTTRRTSTLCATGRSITSIRTAITGMGPGCRQTAIRSDSITLLPCSATQHHRVSRGSDRGPDIPFIRPLPGSTRRLKKRAVSRREGPAEAGPSMAGWFLLSHGSMTIVQTYVPGSSPSISSCAGSLSASLPIEFLPSSTQSIDELVAPAICATASK